MKYLFKDWDRLKGQLAGKYIFLFLDYDGTLTPIAETPGRAVASKEVKNLLERLAKKRRIKLIIISGRSLRNIKRLIGLKNIIYAGNHGLEIEEPKIRYIFELPSSFKAAILRQIKEALNKAFSNIKGILVEDKGLTLSIHYRLAEERDEARIKNIFYAAVKPYLIKKEIRITYGKKVFEIRPPIKWDKGEVALWLLARQRFLAGKKNILPVYIGDDITDEDAFRKLKKKGLTIFVGEPLLSSADYYLNGTNEVIEFLKRISKLR